MSCKGDLLTPTAIGGVPGILIDLLKGLDARELWLSPPKTKRIAMVKDTSTFFGELAPGEAGTSDLASGVVMPLLATLVAVSIG